MDITTAPDRNASAVRPLAGKGAIVTGSTSGIGLGIARALAAAGADVMLNGFGEPAAMSPPARRVERQFGVTVRTRADMSRAEQIEAMVGDAAAKLGTVDILVNNAGIQHVAPIEEFPARQVGPDPAHQPVGCLPYHARGIPGMKAQRLGPDRQHRLGARPGRLAVQVGLCRRQARHRRPDQDRGAGARRDRHHLQRHLPGLCLDPAGRAADRRSGQVARHSHAIR